jgi:hypothetical protein
MGGASSTNGGEKERVYVVGGKARGRKKDQDVRGWIILGWMF